MRRRSVRGVIPLSPQRMQRLRLAVAVAALAALAAVPSAAEATAKPPGGPGPAPVKRGHHGGVSKPHVPRALSRSAPEAAWVELGPSGAVLARAITQADSCPKLTVDKAAARMEERAAPSLFVRGDHELCSRAGPGWFRFLDPRRMPASCQDLTEPYSVDLGRVRMLVLDTALASDRPPLNPDPYVSQFAALRAMAGSNAWLLAHKPMWGLLPDSTGASVTVLNPTLQAASGNSLPPGVRLVLTGHIHLAEVLGFAGGRPPQIVAGISGTLLLPPIRAPLVGMTVAGETLATAT